MIDYTKVPDELKNKILEAESKKPIYQQLRVLNDLTDIVQELLSVVDEQKNEGATALKGLGATLLDIREKITSLDSKEAPETPDHAKPVVSAISELKKALTASIKAIEVKPEVNVSPTEVNVPEVDLSNLEKVLKTDIPKAFEKAVKALPQPKEVQQTDYTEKFDAMLEQLESIDTASRMKPQFPISQLNSIKTAIENVSTVASNLYATKIDTTTTAGVIYIGKAAIGSSSASAVWQIKKLDTNTLALDKKWADSGAFTQIWDNRTSLTYA